VESIHQRSRALTSFLGIDPQTKMHAHRLSGRRPVGSWSAEKACRKAASCSDPTGTRHPEAASCSDPPDTGHPGAASCSDPTATGRSGAASCSVPTVTGHPEATSCSDPPDTGRSEAASCPEPLLPALLLAGATAPRRRAPLRLLQILLATPLPLRRARAA
jgi:hypothetical protein